MNDKRDTGNRSGSTPTFPPPPTWQRPLATALQDALLGQEIEGVVGGSRWLSLRVGGRFLWMIVQPPLRMAWLDERPAGTAWLEALGRHAESPFAGHLRGRRVEAVRLRKAGDGDGGLMVALSGNVSLHLATWPKPGGLWVTAEGAVLAQSGALPEAKDLQAEDPTASDRPGTDVETDRSAAGADQSGDHAPLDLAAHTARAREVLAHRLEGRVRRRLGDVSRAARRRADGTLKALEKETKEARRAEELRAQGDLLAANLHKVRRSQKVIVLEGFDGEKVSVTLDPRLSPGDNLQRIYKRAAKAERKGPAVEVRRETALAEKRQAQEELDAIEAAGDLEALMELAAKWRIDVTPPEAGQPKSAPRPPAPRLPYKRFRLKSGLEVWVGRSARDNDQLSLRHGSKSDLWLHAQSVEGSHVVLRTGGKPTARDDILQAAQLAALYSKARNASTVPVVVTEKRYVRKPRKSPPGTVIAERTKTEFVSPEMPAGCETLGARD